jgi:hypothetical protein
MAAMVAKADSRPYGLSALFRIDPDLAVEAFNKSKARFDASLLSSLASLQSGCSAAVSQFLYKLLDKDDQFVPENAIDALLHARCPAPDSGFLGFAQYRGKTFGYLRQVQQRELRKVFFAFTPPYLKNEVEKGWGEIDDSNFGGRLIEQLPFSGEGSCDTSLPGLLQVATPNHRVDVIEYLLNSCTGLALHLVNSTSDNDRVVTVELRNDASALDSVSLNVGTDYSAWGRLADLIARRNPPDKLEKRSENLDALIDDRVNSYRFGLSLSQTPNPQEDLVFGDVLRWVALRGRPVEQLGEIEANAPSQDIKQMARAAILMTDPQKGVDLILQHFFEMNSNLGSLYAWLRAIVWARLPQDALARLLQKGAEFGRANIYHVSLATMYGSPEEAIQLLTSPDSAARVWAMSVIGFRDDIMEISKSVSLHPPAHDPSIAPLLAQNAEDRARLGADLATVPDSLVDWRASLVMNRLMLGTQLAALKSILKRKGSIEFPFNRVLLW